MNLYLCVSEELNGYWQDPNSSYCIAELAVARNASQARYLTWKVNAPWQTPQDVQDIRNMPRFQTKLRQHGVDGPARIVSSEPTFQSCWEDDATSEPDRETQP